MSLLVSLDDSNKNILTPQNIDTIYEIYRTIYVANNKTGGSIFNDIEYNEICLTAYPSSDICLSDMSNIFAMIFQNDPNLWNDKTSLLNAINTNPSRDLFIGGIKTAENDTDIIKSGTMINFVYELESYKADTDHIVYEYMEYWNNYWLEHSNDYKADGLNIFYVNDRSLDDEVWRVIFGDLEIFGVAFTLMILYFIFALGKLDCINTRVWLAFSIGAVLLCALVSGFGIGLWLGGELSMVVMLIPYVLLGVGVDDMVIIVHSFDEAKKIHKENVLAHSLQESGIAISLTSMCSCVALLCGTILPGIPPALQSFGLMGFLAFFFLYFMQFFVFAPLMLIDEKRKQRKGNFCCFCFTYENNMRTNSDSDMRVQLKKQKVNEKCNGDIVCSKIMVNIMRFRIIRWILIVIFIAAAIYSFINIKNVSTQSNLTLMVPDDSPIIDYYDELDIGFNEKSLIELQIIIENTDFSNSIVRWSVLKFLSEIEEQIDFIGQQNWLQPFIEHLKVINMDINDLNTNEFYEHLEAYAHNDTAANVDIKYKRNSFGNITAIESTRFYIFAFQDSDGVIQWDEYKQWNDLLKKYGINGYIFHSGYGFSYVSSIIVSLTSDNMISAAFAVFLILLLSADIRMAIFILIVVGLIDIDLVGCLYFFDFDLNIITYSVLVMSVGLTVDYVIHISFAILEAKEKSNNNFHVMLEIAMKNMGTSVLNGAFTSVLGGIPLLFSQSSGFRIFGAMWVSIIVIAVLHGFLFVPAVLGEGWTIYRSIYHPTPRVSSVVVNGMQTRIELNINENDEYKEQKYEYNDNDKDLEVMEEKYNEDEEKEIETNYNSTLIVMETPIYNNNNISIDLAEIEDVMDDVLQDMPDFSGNIQKSVE
eukprot:76471_1